MKIIFMLDNGQYLELTPDQLKLVSSAQTVSLGVNILVPVEPNEDGTPNPSKIEFHPIIDYPNVTLVTSGIGR
jgi:hypothetical protein